MARLENARDNHISRWVIPTASQLLIERAGKETNTQALDKVAYIEMGQSPPGETCNEIGDGIPLIGGPADLGLEFPETTRWTTNPTKLCKNEDIIVCVRATIGEPRWANGIYCLGRGVAGIRPTIENLDTRFLFRVIEGSESWLRAQGTGTTFKTISKKHLAAIRVPMVAPEIQRAIADFLEWLERNQKNRSINFSDAPLLPSFLDEQRRLVARIETLAAKVEQAQRLRRQAVGEVEALCRSIVFQADGWESTPTPMKKLVTLRTPDVTVKPVEVYHFAGVYSFGRGVFSGLTKQGLEFSYKKLTKLEEGNFTYPKLMAWEGAFGIVPPECDGCVVSPEFPVFEVDEDKILPEVLDIYFKTPSVWPIVAGLSIGTNVRRRRLQPKAFLSYKFPLPPMEVQLRLRNIMQKLDPVTKMQAATSIKMEALLPSILDRAFKGEL